MGVIVFFYFVTLLAGVAHHLAPFLPGHPVVPCGGEGENTRIKSDLTVSAAPYGSAAILPISWMYNKMLG